VDRRAVLLGAAGLPLRAAADQSAAALLRQGGVVAALRHALAPGTFDPPGFRLGDCSTQRNLGDEGRVQAQAIGRWFDRRGLKPRHVLTSPWCRCIDTAQLAFGRGDVLEALGSPVGQDDEDRTRRLQLLRQALQGAAALRGGFDVWVTHMFVLADLTGESTHSGEALILRADPRGLPMVLGRLSPS
jgi:hypothetical protein